jgi:hypothetical protein
MRLISVVCSANRRGVQRIWRDNTIGSKHLPGHRKLAIAVQTQDQGY